MSASTTTTAVTPPLRSREPVIELRDLVKTYGKVNAVDGISLSVTQGEIFGILGPNGAGKTTTLEMIEGLRPPDAGSITVCGIDAVADGAAVRRLIGVQLQTTALFDYLSAAELIELFAGLYETDGSPERIDHLLTMVGLQEKRRARVNELSGGQRQRLSITLALVNQPRVTFLDEPTTGLDPAARRGLWQVIQDVRAAGTTVVLTTHYMEEAQLLCDRVAILDRGRLIACDTPDALIRNLGIAATIRAQIAEGALEPAALSTLPAVTSATIHNGTLELRSTDAQESLIGLLNVAEHHGAALTGLRTAQPTLEDVFLSLTGRTYEHPPEETATTEKRGRRRSRSA